jgi:hypothetical protein
MSKTCKVCDNELSGKQKELCSLKCTAKNVPGIIYPVK